MKLTFTLLTVLILEGLSASAQEKAIQFGFRAGISSTKFSRTLQPDIQVRDADTATIGYYAGAFATLNVNRFSIQPGVYFNTRGGKTTEEVYQGDIIFSGYGNWRLFYIQVPVNILYNLPTAAGSFYVGAGPYISTALSGKFSAERIDGYRIEEKYEDSYSFKATIGTDQNRSFKRFDYGLNALAGFRLNNGLLIDAGYDLGLGNIEGQSYIYSSTKNRSLHFGLGYQF
ncbi:porin family protein [Mucilaginibacter sp.]|uniref:porin family protein n=1 Tax=Mucilaginibacter sp. TaxID=1882438 RepID=UPI0035BBB1B6